MNVQLKDGRTVEIALLDSEQSTTDFLDFINRLIEEDGYLEHNKKFTIEEQEKWKKDTLSRIEKGDELQYFAFFEGKPVGGSGAKRGVGRNREHVSIGIVVSKEFRGTTFEEGN